MEEFPGGGAGAGRGEVGDPGGMEGGEENEAGPGSRSHSRSPPCVCVCLCVGRVPFTFASVVAALANGPQGELGVPSATAIS